jgi:hypothetical protein
MLRHQAVVEVSFILKGKNKKWTRERINFLRGVITDLSIRLSSHFSLLMEDAQIFIPLNQQIK